MAKRKGLKAMENQWWISAYWPGEHRLAPVHRAPEPKQGSEEPIEPVTELEAEKSTSKILRNLLVKAEAERDDARATKDMHKERQEKAWAEVAALRADLVAAREEIAKRETECLIHGEDYTRLLNHHSAEKARADRAEVRVKELTKAAKAVVDVRPDLPNTLRGEIEALAAILASAHKEGGSR